MNILWVAPDRSRQVLDSFYSLMIEAGKHCKLEILLRPMDRLEIDICIDSCKNGIHPPSIIDPEYANTFDVVITDSIHCFMGEDWKSINALKCLIYGDQHGGMVSQYIRQAYEDFGFSLFLPLYRDATLIFHPYLPLDIIRWLPTWADTRYFRDWGEEKKYEVLLTGVTHPVVYPWRHLIQETCTGKPWFFQIERPYDTFEGVHKLWPIRKDYGRVLNATKIAPTDTSRFHYTIGKVMEIPASKAVLACDFTGEMSNIGFVPWKNFIPLVDGGNLPAQFEAWLQRDDLMDIAQAGHDLIYQRHTDIVRARQLIQMLEKYQ